MILLLDNYDSFTYNLWHYLLQLNEDCIVKRNDEITIEEIEKLNPKAIVLSPGPGRPADSGVMNEVIKHFYQTIPLLGICLGHQAIGEFFGAKLLHADKPVHGKTSQLIFQNHFLFQNISSPLMVMRYHSLLLKELVNTPLKIIATTNSVVGEEHQQHLEIMAIEHPDYKIIGLQFHPESILTPDGMTMLRNWWGAVGS